MIGYLIDKKHFSFDNINRLCSGKLADDLRHRNDCRQCKAIFSIPCVHNQYYCITCIGKWIDSGEFEGYSRSCWQHISFIEFNEFFNYPKSCLSCYRKMTKEFTNRNLLTPATILLLQSAETLNYKLTLHRNKIKYLDN